MGWTITPGCKANIDKLGGRPCDDPVTHCRDTSDYTHRVCVCAPPFDKPCQPPTPNCCPYSADSPIPAYDKQGMCFCCCSCFAQGTLVHISEKETKAVEQFIPGDQVWAASIENGKPVWSQLVVEFSDGTGNLAQNSLMLSVTFESPDGEQTLNVTPNHIFMLATGDLKRADRLVPGRDSLMRYDGTASLIVELHAGILHLGVHHIATSLTPSTDPNGHLLCAKGVLSGDYALQVATAAHRDMLPAGHDDLPSFGTPGYAEAHGAGIEYNGMRASVAGRAATRDAAMQSDGFTPLNPRGVVIPEGAHTFVSDDQALEILFKAPRQPAGSPIGSDMCNYLFMLYGGFYPGVNWVLDHEVDLPNAYSWVLNDQPTVLVAGGLVRTDCINLQALAIIIAHELGHIYGGPPTGPGGLSCQGEADYAGVGSVMRRVWMGPLWGSMLDNGLPHLDTYFGFISDQSGGSGTCNSISIDCRKSAMRAAMTSMPLPECAGGPKVPFLTLDSATAEKKPKGVVITATFNAAVDVQTAENVANYGLVPPVDVTSATVDGDDPQKVLLAARIASGTTYTLWVNNVLSAKGQPIISGKNYAEVELP